MWPSPSVILISAEGAFFSCVALWPSVGRARDRHKKKSKDGRKPQNQFFGAFVSLSLSRGGLGLLSGVSGPAGRGTIRGNKVKRQKPKTRWPVGPEGFRLLSFCYQNPGACSLSALRRQRTGPGEALYRIGPPPVSLCRLTPSQRDRGRGSISHKVYTNSMTAISAASPLRVPMRVTLV